MIAVARKPVEIVGGGLAGLSLGIGLRNAGVPVTVFEAEDYPRHRVCGEFITGLSEATVQRLGIGDVFKEAQRIRELHWFLRDRPLRRMRLPNAAIGISRFTLDERLARLFVALGGRLVTRNRETDTDKPGRVATSGRRRCGASPWVGLKAHLKDIPLVAGLEVHLGDGAYVGLSRVEDGWINICGLFRRRRGLQGGSPDGLARTLRTSGLEVLANRVAGAELRPGSAKAVAGFVFDRVVPATRRVELGDHCAMVPPFTGNGMAMAFTGAALAVEPLAAWSAGDATWDAVSRCIHDSLQSEFGVRLRSAALLHPWLLRRGGQRCLGGLARAGLLPVEALYRVLH